MISRDSFSKDHIMTIHAESHRDPGLIERSIFAFGLLEALRQVGMDFIFKGGSSMSPRIMYLCSCLLSGGGFEFVTDSEAYKQMKFEDERLSGLKGIRKSNPKGYAYLIKADSELRK